MPPYQRVKKRNRANSMHEKSNTLTANAFSIAAQRITNNNPTPLKNNNGKTTRLGVINKANKAQATVNASIPI